MRYLAITTIENALRDLWGTADHMLKIWFVLKHMGLAPGAQPVVVTTANPTDSLKRLFSCGSPDGDFYVPFSHTPRFASMKHDAARSIIQTNIKRWQESGSVVTVDPSQYLDFSAGPDDKVLVSTGRNYPIGLGYGKNGFALEDETRVAIPLIAFAVWYGRITPIPDDADPNEFLTKIMMDDLHLTQEEIEAIFIRNPFKEVTTSKIPVNERQLFALVNAISERGVERQVALVREPFATYEVRINSMVTPTNGPKWLRVKPEGQLKSCLEKGATAIMLYGPPRTGKTRAVDMVKPRTDKTRETIQIHEGWGYDELIVAYRPLAEGKWDWVDGILVRAINTGKTLVVLEEANRTQLTQALGEVFSLLEPAYRGKENAVTLRSGRSFYIPKEVVIIAALNTLDKSTEDIDDALLGRMTGIEFPPRVEALSEMLEKNKVPAATADKVRHFFAAVQVHYPLGHGYFCDFSEKSAFIDYYLTRIRPVLQAQLQNYRDDDLKEIDNTVDALFGK